MTVSENGLSDTRGREVTPTDVLDAFAVYQVKTAGMVADEFGVDREAAVILLDELVARRSLTKMRGHTETPAWILPHPPRTRLHEQ